MTISFWPISGFAARGDEAPTSANVKDWMVWRPVTLSALSTEAIRGPLSLYLAPKISTLLLPEFAADTVLLGVPLGDIESDWRMTNGIDKTAHTVEDAATLFDASLLAHHTDSPHTRSIVQIPTPLTMEMVQVVVAREASISERARDILGDTNGRTYVTLPEMFP